LISPPAAVLLIAPAKVLHGAVRLHGLTSSPTPDTHVRVAWALAGAAKAKPASPINAVDNILVKLKRIIFPSPKELFPEQAYYDCVISDT
jgi:hypothetical protein